MITKNVRPENSIKKNQYICSKWEKTCKHMDIHWVNKKWIHCLPLMQKSHTTMYDLPSNTKIDINKRIKHLFAVQRWHSLSLTDRTALTYSAHLSNRQHQVPDVKSVKS